MPHLPLFSSPTFGSGNNRRMTVLACVYAAVISASLYMAYEVRFDFLVPEQHQQERVRLLALAVGIKLIALVLARQLGTLLEVVPESWTGRIVNPESETRSPCPRNDVSTVPI